MCVSALSLLFLCAAAFWCEITHSELPARSLTILSELEFSSCLGLVYNALLIRPRRWPPPPPPAAPNLSAC